MKALTISAIDSLFSYLHSSDLVLWIRDKNYQKQIYISPSFEQIWEIPPALLYEDKGLLIRSTLLEVADYSNWIALDEQKKLIGQQSVETPVAEKSSPSSNDLLLRIKTAGGKEKFLFDSSYLLVDEKNNHIGFAGVAKSVTQDEWFARYYANRNQTAHTSENVFKQHIFDLLRRESKTIEKETGSGIPEYFFQMSSKKISFTKRECECIYHAQAGKSAKETARALNISPRTIEFHLSNAQEKAGTKNKIALLSKVLYK